MYHIASDAFRIRRKMKKKLVQKVGLEEVGKIGRKKMIGHQSVQAPGLKQVLTIKGIIVHPCLQLHPRNNRNRQRFSNSKLFFIPSYKTGGGSNCNLR